MATFEITAPDGGVYQIEGANEAGAVSALKKLLEAEAKPKVSNAQAQLRGAEPSPHTVQRGADVTSLCDPGGGVTEHAVPAFACCKRLRTAFGIARGLRQCNSHFVRAAFGRTAHHTSRAHADRANGRECRSQTQWPQRHRASLLRYDVNPPA